MSTRKLQQEMEKVFKKIDEGVAEFEALHEKIEQSTNPAQKEKLEDQLKREIKKLQRMRDQIKTWAASNDIKDKSPLLEKRKLIETQMEKFKAIEKAMKTKAYSKEGLSAAARLDPKEQAKLEAGEFLGEMVDSLEQQIEELEVTAEALSNAKRSKNNGRQERLDEIEGKIERHKYHQGKLELIRRSLENGGIETEQVKELEEEISYYVKSNQDSDFIENDYIYDDLNLDADEDNFGMHISDDKSTGDTTSTHDDGPSPGEAIIEQLKASSKPRNTENLGKRQVSAQLKSPLPSLATLHSTPSSSGVKDMKPAPVPMRPAGEGLKYASAAAAAAAADKSNIGLLPLPPPPGAHNYRTSATSSPAASVSQPVSHAHNDTQSRAVPSAKSTPKISSSKLANSTPTLEPATKEPASNSTSAPNKTNDSPSSTPQQITTTTTTAEAPTTGTPNGSKAVRAVSTASTTTTPASVAAPATPVVPQEEECIYHLPASLRDLVEAYEVSYSNPMPPSAPAALRMLDASQRDAPKATDGDRTRHYVPEIPANMPNCTYPTQPLPLLDHPKIYNKLETDTLFYLFYYRQGTVQQYLAAKALKDQSWRFHKQYQTWFQRHEEPKNITEEYEQGTYRFFDYESTWMNRRKADFKFAYKFLEDDI